jgi:hypothetical protein
MFLLKQLRSYQDKGLSTLHQLLGLSNKKGDETVLEHLLLNEQFLPLPYNHDLFWI